METIEDKKQRVAKELKKLLQMRGRQNFLTYKEAEAVREAINLLGGEE